MADITALKRRRAAFAASGLTDKVRRMDAEIAAQRGSDPADDSEPVEVPEPVETGQADLDGVETAAAVRRRPAARKRAAR